MAGGHGSLFLLLLQAVMVWERMGFAAGGVIAAQRPGRKCYLNIKSSLDMSAA
jgi:hypothetical protein